MSSAPSTVERQLPRLAGAAIIAGTAITALSPIPSRLPGIALDSTSLFLVERGTALLTVLIIAVGLVGRTLRRELPTGFSPGTGSITYAEQIADGAASASDATIAALRVRIDEHGAKILAHRADIETLTHGLEEIRIRTERPR